VAKEKNDLAKRLGLSAEDYLPSEATKALEAYEKLMGKVDSMTPALSKIPEIKTRKFDFDSLPPLPSKEESNQYQSASVFLESISKEALNWKNELEKPYIPSVIALLYGGIQIQVDSMSKVSFNGIKIMGKMNGAPCSILAHQSTVQVLCCAYEKKEDEQTNPIGFKWDDKNITV